MKTGYFFVLIIGMLILPAVPDDKARAGTTKQVNPALFAVSRLNVKIEASFSPGRPNEPLENRRELKNRVSSEFEKAGIKLTRGLKKRYQKLPEFTVHLDEIRIEDSNLRVLCIQSRLNRTVLLSSPGEVQLKAWLWESEPAIFLLGEADTEKITEAVLEQVKAFIRQYKLTKTTGPEGIEAGSLAVAGQKNIRGRGIYKYVASRNSEVFHRPGCQWAERIKPENLIGYKSRAEAVKAGKRPCRVCKP